MQILVENSQTHLSERDATGPLSALKKALFIGSTPAQVIHQEGSLSLLRYEPNESLSDAVVSEPVLLIPSLINRHYILDLLPGKSLVEYLVSKGHPVYLIRWETPGDEERWLTAERLIGGRIHRAVSAVMRDAGSDQIHLMGQCIGGTLATAYAIRYPERIKRLALITAPVDFKNAGTIGAWAKAPALDLDALMDAYGNMPWSLMQAAFHLLRPGATIGKYIRASRRITDRAFLRSFAALEIWANDNVSFPGSCYRTLIQTFYRENGLTSGALRIDGQVIRLQDLCVPVMSLSSTSDHIVPVETTLQPKHLQAGSELCLIQSGGGHIGCLLGKKAQSELWPRISQWLN
jgi:polyhydroxyalkanoate synthase